MKFLIVVQGGPYTTQASLSAWHFARAVLTGGHDIYRIFFYHDGVYNANGLLSPPQDEVDLHQAWRMLAEENDRFGHLRRLSPPAGHARSHRG